MDNKNHPNLTWLFCPRSELLNEKAMNRKEEVMKMRGHACTMKARRSGENGRTDEEDIEESGGLEIGVSGNLHHLINIR